jgi:hypothetical protein
MITAKFVRQELREMIDSLKDIGVNSEEINGVIDRYSVQLCREQRESCAASYNDASIDFSIKQAILKSPMPEL